jgi:hypothetical protein
MSFALPCSAAECLWDGKAVKGIKKPEKFYSMAELIVDVDNGIHLASPQRSSPHLRPSIRHGFKAMSVRCSESPQTSANEHV